MFTCIALYIIFTHQGIEKLQEYDKTNNSGPVLHTILTVTCIVDCITVIGILALLADIPLLITLWAV